MTKDTKKKLLPFEFQDDFVFDEAISHEGRRSDQNVLGFDF
jgi:hypothetical protein